MSSQPNLEYKKGCESAASRKCFIVTALLNKDMYMKNKIFVVLMLTGMFTSFSGLAELLQCSINVGNLSDCQPYPSTKNAPLLRSDGKVSLCEINSGQVGSCSSNYDGEIVIKRGSGYSECNVEYGELKGCTPPVYSGSAIIDTSQE